MLKNKPHMKLISQNARQAQKYSIAMAGEYFVAACLQRRGVPVSVDLGRRSLNQRVAVIKATVGENNIWYGIR